MAEEFKHFLDAQGPVYDSVVDELTQGQKRSHWMWFIFPQLASLGSSHMSQKFALQSLEHARRYGQHPELGRRLRQCTQLVIKQEQEVSEIFGYPDDLKFHSSMTLFALADPDDPVFKLAIDKKFAGKKDLKTVELLRGQD